jgi:hypothetical protein
MDIYLLLQLFISPKRRAYIFRFFYIYEKLHEDKLAAIKTIDLFFFKGIKAVDPCFSNANSIVVQTI